MNVLVIQTAFLGDVILTTPLFDALAASRATVDVVVTPAGSQAVQGHRSVRSTIVYDKKGSDRGVRALVRLSRMLRRRSYDLALIPHRSVRSAMLGFLAGIPRRIGFDKSSAAWSLTDVVRYRGSAHEIDRNLDLLGPSGLNALRGALPSLAVSPGDRARASELLAGSSIRARAFVAVAPGSAWNTKRWPEERFASLAEALDRRDVPVVLIGGTEDRDLCARIKASSKGRNVLNAAGQTTVLQSAALIESAAVLVTNDSAPLHLASAMGTPIVAVFGATSPQFGFGPRGDHDVIVETEGLSCRPCAAHGGDRCPVGTFDCMLRISAERVEAAVREIMAGTR